MCFSLQRRAIFPHPNFKKCSEPVSFLTCWLANVLLATAACKFCASELQKVLRTRQFFNILACKCASRYNFQKWSEADVLCTFWLANVLLATVACHFSTSQLQKMVRSCCALYILTCKCASRYSGVQFFIGALNSYLRTRRFTEPAFRPSRPTNHWKNTAIRDFPNISRVWIFFLLTFAQLYLLSSDSTSFLCFSSSDSASLLCFFSCPYCRKLDF